MRQFIDEIFYDEAHQVDKPVEGLKNWGLYGDVPVMVEAFQIWSMSNFQVLPFRGGWLDQPTWVRATFKMLLKIDRWHHQNAGRVAPEELKPLND